MTDLLLYDLISDFKSLGLTDVAIDYEQLDIAWVDDLDFMEDKEND
jgi:hypothetical protein